MGRRNRERIQRIREGKEEPIAVQQARKIASNPVGRRILRRASRQGVVDELSKGDVTEQIDRLDSLRDTGELSGNELGRAIRRKAPGEMDKAIRNFRRQGKEITVDSLCHEVKTTPGFLQACDSVGITLEWFENLARERMKANGVTT